MAANQELQAAILQMTKLLQRLAVPQAANPEQVLESLSTNISEFRFDPENGTTFEKWFARYSDLFESDARSLDDAAKVRLLLRKLDTCSHSRYVNYILPQLPKDIPFADTIKTLQKIFGRQTSVFNKRYQCLQLVKSEADDIISYGGQVNRACEEFEFQNLSIDQFKCLIFVCGLKAPRYADIRARLLSRIEGGTDEAPVTIQTLIDEFQRIVNLKSDTTMIEHPSSSNKSVHSISERKSGIQQRPSKTESKSTPRTPCWQCGQMHFVRDCPFSDHLCKACNRIGHKEGYCGCMRKSGDSSTKPQAKKKKHFHKKVGSRTEAKGIYVNHIANSSRKRRFRKRYHRNSKATWHQLGKPKLTPSSIEASNASGGRLNLIGEFNCDVTLNDMSKSGQCFVTSSPDLNVLGIDWIDMFNLWSVPFDTLCSQISSISKPCFEEITSQLQATHPTVFDNSLGHCKKTKVKLFLKSNVKPVFCSKRPVPFNTISLVDAELTRLQSLNIITPIDFSEWAAPIVAVRKPNGKVRICADYSTGLNEALESNHYPLPVPEEIFAQLNGSSIFSIIDLSDAYLQVEVDEESKKLLTINTHRGLFQFNRLAPGVKSAPGAFQRLVDTMIADIPGVRSFLDDVIIFGPTWEAHKASLDQLLQRLEEYGFHVKMEKCHFFQTAIKYLGHIIDNKGIRPDPEKLQAIASIPAPTNVSELRSFLGAINFYGRFVRNIHELRHPLDQLLKKDAKWQWNNDCQRSFRRFKEILQSEMLLTHYDPKLPIIVAADASSTGIGAVIFHEFPNGHLKAIQHASRSLTAAEQGYGQPEKEALALTYGVTKFHKYLLGRRFTLLTDHKPLLSIFGSKKGIPLHTANRLQRWALMLLNYDFDFRYVSTNEFGCADMLSRLIDRTKQPEEDYIVAAISLEEDMVSIIHDTVHQVPVSFAAIQTATKTDKALQTVLKFIRDGWPTDPRSITNPDVRPYLNRRDSLTHVDGCILFHERVVVPSKFRKQILNQFHRGHPGMVRMKSIARSFVYWPGIDKDIEDFIRRCTPCCTAGKTPTKSTPESWPMPDKPWSRIHVDYAGPVDGLYFLVIVDPYTKWPEVYATRITTTKTTTKLLSQSFSTFGVPETIVSDNGTQFTSHEFQVFCEKQGIRHIRTAPYHPQSNGLAERFVDTLKRTLRKIRSGGETLEEALLIFLQVYRTTPTADLGNKSPAEIMFGRSIRTVSSILLPTTQCIPATQTEQQTVKNGAVSRQFAPGDSVYVQVHQDRQRLIRSHINQLKHRVTKTVPDPGANQDPSPLSVFVDGFGLEVPARAVPAVVPNPPPNGDVDSDGSEYYSDGSSENDGPSQPDPVPVPVATPPRERRQTRLPSRFEPYWMA
ncbi:uncharacterized protein K02A2.6-like [Uranotaenia lowii]|uniref:uncharacterized protein K02A2.6-like n=1 Tax=Uranotaenia lowii TaxID=190385 RepID=UPI0024786D7E|nr:uncharacterized protein K02A2.6-like [Uranotaenia lowii]